MAKAIKQTDPLGKDKIRIEALQQLESLNIDQRNRWSADIRDKLLGENIDSRVFIYLATPQESDLDPLIELLLDSFQQLYVPYWDNVWKIAELESLERIETRQFGIRQPTHVETYSTLSHAGFTQNDICIVPGVAFSRNLERLGHGNAIYDRYLKECISHKVGVCFEAQLYSSLPTEEHDIKMDTIVTEKSTL